MGVFAVTSERTEREIALPEKLRALVLLGGSVRPGRLISSIGRPVFDLPHRTGYTILDGWRREATNLARLSGAEALPVRVMLDRAASYTPSPASQAAIGMAQVQVERDPFDYRGTGGVLRDLAAGYADDDLLVVANAAQVMLASLAQVVENLAETDGDVSIASNLDGTASGLWLIRCASLRELPASGFVDMKEQALPAIAKRHRVTVVHYDEPAAVPVRSLADYIDALRRNHRGAAGRAAATDPFAEDWEPSFGIAEDGALVDPSARLHDSVVLRGGRVEADAVLVHSIVCPGGVVRRGQTIVDDLVTAGNGRRK
jgi:hypothetical protein